MKKLALLFAFLLIAGTANAQVWRWDFQAPAGSIITANGSNPVTALTQGSTAQILTSGGTGGSPAWITTVPLANGGTGFTSAGVVLGADTATTGQALIGSPLQFTTVANQRYYVSGTTIATSSTAAGLKLGIRIPAGDTGYFVFNGTDTTTLQPNVSAVTADSGLTAVYGQLNGTCYVTFTGIVSGPTAGPVIEGFLKGASGTATLKQWSSLIWKRLY